MERQASERYSGAMEPRLQYAVASAAAAGFQGGMMMQSPPAVVVAAAPGGGGGAVGASAGFVVPPAAAAAGYNHIQQQQLHHFWSSQMLEVQHVTEFKAHHQLPLARIKKIMKAEEDVRMIAAEAPVLFAKACEMFILELTLRSWMNTEENKRRTLQKNDISAAIARTDMFDFLVDIVPRDELREEGLAAAAAMARPAPPSAGLSPATADAMGAYGGGGMYYYVARSAAAAAAVPARSASAGAGAIIVGGALDPACALYRHGGAAVAAFTPGGLQASQPPQQQPRHGAPPFIERPQH